MLNGLNGLFGYTNAVALASNALATVTEKATGLKDEIYNNLFSVKEKVIKDAKTQIEEIEGFLTNETIKKLDAFKQNHTNVANVITRLKGIIKELNGDTNQPVECSYYKTYEDIGNNNITTISLTLQNVEEIKALQERYCDDLFKDNDKELHFISKHASTIGKNINLLLQIINENKNDTTKIVSELTPLLNKLIQYRGKIFEYIFVVKCGKNGIKDLYKGKGGGSYKKTNKKNILGKERCIYKITGDRKEYIKYKGNFIAVREYKKLLKTR